MTEDWGVVHMLRKIIVVLNTTGWWLLNENGNMIKFKRHINHKNKSQTTRGKIHTQEIRNKYQSFIVRSMPICNKLIFLIFAEPLSL